VNRRWYDKEITCHRLMEQIRAMPQPEVREFCARVVIHFAEKLREEIHKKGKKGMLNSLGAPAIAGLYRFGHQKRRWYDRDPVLHKAAGYFYMLPLEGLAAIGFKLGDALGLIQIYALVCSQVDEKPDMAEMIRISKTAMQAGKAEAEAILISIIGKELYQSLTVTLQEQSLREI
jgi:hypothetical protein